MDRLTAGAPGGAAPPMDAPISAIQTSYTPSALFRMANAGLEIASRLGLVPGLPAATAEAVRKLGPAPASPQAREGLERLLDALANESELSAFGRMSVHWDLKRLLNNAAHVRTVAAQAAAAGTDAVQAPIFILGLPRSGTTFLHALMAEDPDNLVPRVWQTITPRPRPAGFRPDRDAASRSVDRQLRIFAGFTPEFKAVHPIDADSPQECSEIAAHVFQSLRFDTTFRIPSYTSWLDGVGHDEAFAFHRQFLVCLQQGLPARRWVLKCPDHTFSMPEILRTYPDARFVIVHRDPIRVFASVAHLTEVLRRPFLSAIDPAEVGRQVVERWIEGAHRLVAFDRSTAVPADRKINIRYETLTADPLAAIERIYGHFGLALGDAGRAAIAAKLVAKPRGGYPDGRRYALARFGIRTDTLMDGFRSYLDHFGIALPGELPL